MLESGKEWKRVGRSGLLHIGMRSGMEPEGMEGSGKEWSGVGEVKNY